MSRSDDDDNDSEDGGPDAMMSIFASYYGIDDEDNNENKGGKKKGKSQEIDSAHFDSDEYVRDLLETTPIERLVQQDSSMVHEIRSLDSDMQMLVYENYSKFISATETIRRMKSNVEAMHDDMESVKYKMDAIGKSSSQLDASLSPKQSKVAKLVRVRRLLTRLTFLSELPEKLAEMIDREQYSKAVRLYSKTIHILKQHSHVLSFKNIQERTEQMMQDLRGKVMNLLDDPSLDAAKLTQYVAVVRLMEAPRKQVIEKFLSAHKSRASRMIRQFTGNNGGQTNGIASPCSFYPSSNDKVDNARKFHQSYIAGLIECCKGICELFGESPSLAIMSPTSKLELAVPKSKDPEHTIDAELAKNRFESTLAILMPEYSLAMTTAIAKFYERYNANIEAYIVLEKELESAHDSDSLNQQLRAAQLRAYDFEEERQSWLMLIRQAILDCQFLDSEINVCIRKTCDTATEGTVKYSDSISMAILTVLDNSNDAAFSRRVKNFIQSKLLASLPTLCSLCLLDGTGNIMDAMVSSNSTDSFGNYDVQSSSSRSRVNGSLQRMTTNAQSQLDNIVEAFLSTLTEVCAESRPIIEIQSVIKGSKGQNNSILMIQKFIDVICNAIEETLQLSLRSGSFVDSSVSADIDREIFVENFDQKHDKVYNLPKLHMISNANSIVADNPFGEDNNNEGALVSSHSETNNASKAKEFSISILILLAFFKKVLNVNGGFKQKIEALLLNHDFQQLSPLSQKSLEIDCIGRIQNLCQNLLIAFVDHNANHAISYISDSVSNSVINYPLPSISAGSNANDVHIDGVDSREISVFLSNLKISPEVNDFIEYLDHILSSCCILLAEQAPQAKLTTVDDRMPLNRRGSTRQSIMGTRGSIMGARTEVGLQLDIERLFAQKIKIFDKDALIASLQTGSILETSISTILKAIIKGGHEKSRMLTFSHSAYVNIQVDIMCIRQLASSLLKENDTESLCDQWLSSLFARYIYANELPSLGDINETTAISRASNDGFLNATKKCFLIPR